MKQHEEKNKTGIWEVLKWGYEKRQIENNKQEEEQI